MSAPEIILLCVLGAIVPAGLLIAIRTDSMPDKGMLLVWVVIGFGCAVVLTVQLMMLRSYPRQYGLMSFVGLLAGIAYALLTAFIIHLVRSSRK